MRKFFDALAPLLGRFCLRLGDRDPRHGQKKARIDAVIAGPDAFAALDAASGPSARRLQSVAAAHNVEHAANDRARLAFNASLGGDRTGFHALAASGARVRHGERALVQSSFEALHHLAGDPSAGSTSALECPPDVPLLQSQDPKREIMRVGAGPVTSKSAGCPNLFRQTLASDPRCDRGIDHTATAWVSALS